MAHLFICLTPLQALIAQKLIIQHQPALADLLMLSYVKDNQEKFRYYFGETAALCRRAIYLDINKNRFSQIVSLSSAIKKLDKHYDTVFLASIDNFNAQYPLGKITFKHLETFDDGTGNLYPSSIFYRNKPRSWLKQRTRQLLGIPYQTEDLRQLSRCHHTLYPNLPNIVSPTKPLILWENQENTSFSGSLKKKTIFLGQPLFRDNETYARLINTIHQKYALDAYFPHPRETWLPENIPLIHTPLIFEDWLLNALKEEPNTQFELYHFASTAALNVASFPRIRIQALRPNLPLFHEEHFDYLYQLMPSLDIAVQSI